MRINYCKDGNNSNEIDDVIGDSSVLVGCLTEIAVAGNPDDDDDEYI